MNPEILNRVKELVKSASEATPETVFSKLAHLEGFLEGITDERAHVSPKRDFVDAIKDHAEKKKGQRQCHNCKEYGHTAKKCQNAAVEAPETDQVGDNEPWGDPLSEEEYNSVMEVKRDGLPSRDAARSLELNLREVNTAWPSTDYENYLGRRPQ